MRLQTMLVLMAPFVLVALFHSHRLTGALTSGLSGGGRPRLSLIGAGRHAWRGGLPPAAWRPPVDEAEARLKKMDFEEQHEVLRGITLYRIFPH